MLYLTSPYWDKDEKVMVARCRAASRLAHALLEEGRMVFCSAAHSHEVRLHGSSDAIRDHLARFEPEMLGVCNGLYVLQLPGWEASPEVGRAIRHALESGWEVNHFSATKYWVPPQAERQEALLEEAQRLITADRHWQYGPYKAQASKIAELAGIMRGKTFGLHDVPAIHIATKLVRESYAHKRDNLVDAAGYLGLWEKLHLE